MAHRRRCRRHLYRHGAARFGRRRSHLQGAVGARRSQRRRARRAAAGGATTQSTPVGAAARLRAVRARLDGPHQSHPGEEGRQGRHADHGRLPRLAGDPPGHTREPVDHRAPYPPVLVPRHLRLPVRGRVAADGAELAPLMTEDVVSAAKAFDQEAVESIAVCLFNSFLDGRHERVVGEALAKSWNGQWISLSSDVVPTMGEYERSSTAVVNAYIAPKVTGYLSALDEQLRQLGLPRSLLLLQSNGGAVSVDEIANRPVMLVLSGPAAGVGALKGCVAQGESANFISMEIG